MRWCPDRNGEFWYLLWLPWLFLGTVLVVFRPLSPWGVVGWSRWCHGRLSECVWYSCQSHIPPPAPHNQTINVSSTHVLLLNDSIWLLLRTLPRKISANLHCAQMYHSDLLYNQIDKWSPVRVTDCIIKQTKPLNNNIRIDRIDDVMFRFTSISVSGS